MINYVLEILSEIMPHVQNIFVLNRKMWTTKYTNKYYLKKLRD